MASVEAELDSFVDKFSRLWRAGYDAHLDLNSHAGNAWVGIRLNLGRNTSADHAQDFVKKRESPSRMRRRDRRAAERQGESNLANSESVEIIQKDNDNDGEASENMKTVIDVSQVEVVAEEAFAEIPDNFTEEEPFIKNVLVENAVIEDVNVNGKITDVSVAVEAEKDRVITDKSTEEVEIASRDDDQKDFGTNVTEDRPINAAIHATAIVQNSPYGNFNQDEWNSIFRFITNKDHLKRNVCNVEYCQFRSQNLGNNSFVHTVGLKIIVNTDSLWESPRSYLWRHVGQDVWERGNGSSITLTKIHQK